MNVENTLFKIKAENMNLKDEANKFKQQNLYEHFVDDHDLKLLQTKDKEIEKLKKEIIKEEQIIAHVQMSQEKEIIDKDREISFLSSLLIQERAVILEKEKEI